MDFETIPGEGEEGIFLVYKTTDVYTLEGAIHIKYEEKLSKGTLFIDQPFYSQKVEKISKADLYVRIPSFLDSLADHVESPSFMQDKESFLAKNGRREIR